MSNDFSMYAGDDKVLEAVVEDTSGTVVDITDIEVIRWKMAKTVRGPALVSKALGDGITLINGGEGRFDVALDGEDTEDLRQGDYYHEAEVIDSTGNVSTVFTGTISILPTLIKPETSP
jgi:hypothetical protein